MREFSFQTKKNLAKWLTGLENRNEDAIRFLSFHGKQIGHSKRIGITGPPGTGKSTLVNEICKYLTSQNQTIAVLAVDPTSPFTQGAILGDRIRMLDLSKNEQVFIRSVASRGHLGGLSAQTGYMADAFDIAGYDWVIIETVGIGQSELEIADHSDCVVVVLNPESGDGIQAMKAGLMEISDIFVVNKSDHPNTENFINQMEMILHIQSKMEGWNPPIVKAIATKSEGITNLFEQIDLFYSEFSKSGKLESDRNIKRISVLKSQINDLIINEFWDPEKLEKLNSLFTENSIVDSVDLLKKLKSND